MSKKKILIVTRNLPPLIGGMERLNWHIADELSKNHKIIVISHSKAKFEAPPDTSFYGVRLNPLPLFLLLAFMTTFWVCLRQRPDILFAGSGLTAPIATFWAKFFRKKSIVYIHGLDIGTNNKLYNLLWIPFIRSSDQIIANSSPTYDICLKKGVNEKNLSIIHPGVSFPPQPRNEQLIQQLKSQYDLQDKKILLSVGRLTTRKGLMEFVENSLAYIVQQEPDVVLVVVGESPKNSLGAGLQTREEILEAARKNQIENHILFLGVITDNKQLATIYEAADVHVFPVRHIPDDPEGFGMVAVEAAAHGTPTVAFATGGIVDAVAQGVSGYLVEKNNYSQLSKQVITLLATPLPKENIQDFARQFEWSRFGQGIVQQMER